MHTQFNNGDIVYYYHNTGDTRPYAATKLLSIHTNKAGFNTMVRLFGFDELIHISHIKPFYPLIKSFK